MQCVQNAAVFLLQQREPAEQRKHRVSVEPQGVSLPVRGLAYQKKGNR